jgi:serine/threonine protein kinase
MSVVPFQKDDNFPGSPTGAASAEEVLADEIVRVWTDGLTGTALGLESVGAEEVQSSGCPAQYRYCDPRKRVHVEGMNLSVADAYAISRTLGFGGFATVRQARHNASHQDVTVKIVEKDRAGKSYTNGVVEAGGYEMMLEMSKKPHKNIVQYLDFFESPTRYYVVMERLHGCELTVALTDLGAKWSERNCACVMHDLLSALSHLHQVVGVYHRDVKLENLMFRGRTSGPFAGRKVGGGLVLLDFGLSRFIGQAHDGRVCGTEIYKAPEVSTTKEDGGFSCAVDLWAAGLVLFALLTGDMPFEHEDVARKQAAEVAEANIAHFEDEMAQGGRTIPHALLRGLLHPDPALRWSAARALEDDWLLGAPELPAAKTYSKAVAKSSDSIMTQDHEDTVSTPASHDDTTPAPDFVGRRSVQL